MAPPPHVPQHCLERVASQGEPGLVVRICVLLLVWLRGAWVPLGEGGLVCVYPALPGWGAALRAFLHDWGRLPRRRVYLHAFFFLVRPVMVPGLVGVFFFFSGATFFHNCERCTPDGHGPHPLALPARQQQASLAAEALGPATPPSRSAAPRLRPWTASSGRPPLDHKHILSARADQTLPTQSRRTMHGLAARRPWHRAGTAGSRPPHLGRRW